jgi:hypothetical protein
MPKSAQIGHFRDDLGKEMGKENFSIFSLTASTFIQRNLLYMSEGVGRRIRQGSGRWRLIRLPRAFDLIFSAPPIVVQIWALGSIPTAPTKTTTIQNT